MKHFYFILFIITNIVTAQQIEVVNSLNSPFGMAYKDNYLYMTEWGANKITRIDITNPTASKEDVVVGLNNPISICFIGDKLYIAEYGGGQISYVNLTGNPVLPVSYVVLKTGINLPTDIVTDGIFLYTTEYGNHRVLKIDPANASSSTVKQIYGAFGLTINNDDIYVSSLLDDKVFKIKTSLGDSQALVTIITSGFDGPGALAYKNNKLYIADYVGFKILKVDLSNIPALSSTTLLSYPNIYDPGGLLFINDDLYFSEVNASKISKLPSSTLSTENLTLQNFSVYPNPANKNIQVQTIEEIKELSIYTILGKKVLQTNQKYINVSTLTNGLYLLKVHTYNGKTGIKKFIKQ